LVVVGVLGDELPERVAGAASGLLGMTGFADVDAAADPERFVGYLRDVNGIDAIAAGKLRRMELLGLRPGGRAVDVGCGLGEDARELARIVGPTGHVVGLDSSSAMLDRARSGLCAGPERVEFVVGDAHQLPFEDGTFDAARIERTLQHLADPAQAVREMARVTRRGGMLLATEPDWGTLAITGTPRGLVRVLLEAAERRIRNAWIGRELAGLFIDAGIVETTVLAEVLVIRDHDTIRATSDLPSLLAEVGDRERAEMQELLARLESDCRTGRAVAAMTLFTAAGRVP
jgi:SAM-dependent methyltransferase